MRNRNTIRSLIVTVAITAGFLAVWAASPSKEPVSAPCRESLEGNCCKKEASDNSTKMSWETIPHRFFSSL